MGFFTRKMDRELEAYQRELVDTHYKEVENMYRQIRGWRHDYRNHIQVMKALAAQGDMAGIQDYLDKLDTDLNTVDTVIKTGNAMADAILNSKISLAKARHIPVQADAHIPVKLRMSELDLCVILGNLFDNAIEASLALPEEQRLIRVYMDMKGTQLYISFTNFTATGKQKKIGRRFATTKGAGHGFGLVRIDNIIEMNYSRVPVYHEDKDNIVGVIHIKKLLKAARRYGFDHITIRQVMQPAFFVPETIMIDELLFQMKKSQNQLAILLDEYGGVVGLVTLEDLLEEIVGEIEDETDEPTETVKQLSETEFLIDGKMPVDDFNDEFAAHLETTTADTIAGYVIEQLGFFPEEGQVLNVRTPEGIILETHQVIDGTRIAEIKLRLPQQLAKLYDKRILEQAKLDEKLGN